MACSLEGIPQVHTATCAGKFSVPPDMYSLKSHHTCQAAACGGVCLCRLEGPMSLLAVFDEMRRCSKWPAGAMIVSSNIVLDSLSGDLQAAFAK